MKNTNLLEKLQVPGTKTCKVVIVRKDVKKEIASYQLEFNFEFED
ncbi:hypothetical protein [Anaerobacillus sp. CMMVII]|nr:hypothetical protein [Anaerobacillus sp. CMMVII]